MEQRDDRSWNPEEASGHGGADASPRGKDVDLPYEKFERFGPEHLTESELLAIILRTGTRGESAVDLARKVLSLGRYPRTGLLGLYDTTVEELCQIPGIGPVKAVKLKSLAELSMRMHRARAERGLCVHDPSTVAEYYMEQLRHLANECAVLACFDAKNQLIAQKRLSEGTVNTALVSVRSVFLEALQSRAVGLILVHNHPSGDPTPSRTDRELTARIAAAGRLMDIPLLDHIVIGDNCYYSFQEDGKL